MLLPRVLAGGVFGLLSAGLFGQTPAVFRSETNYVEVDVVVTDRQGRYVGDLAVTDFDVAELGKPQKIVTFTPIDLPTTVGGAGVTPPPVRFRPSLPQAERPDASRIYLLYLSGGGLLVRQRARVETCTGFATPAELLTAG